MEHLLLKAAVTAATDQGTFTAVISTASVDRDGDIVEPKAIVAALEKWAAIGKLVPLAYSHRDPKTGQAVVVGHIDPATVRLEGKEVVSDGFVDQSTERGQETWRLVKSGTLSFSYGYLIPDGGATKRSGTKNGLHITKLDLYEISVVPVAPANNDTRVLSWKAKTETQDAALEALNFVRESLADDKLQQETKDSLLDQIKALVPEADVTDQEPEKAPSVDPLRKHARETALRVLSGGVQPSKQVPQEPKPQPDMDPAALRKYSRDVIVHILSGGHSEGT
jgi:HK97 family phage prohead protease